MRKGIIISVILVLALVSIAFGRGWWESSHGGWGGKGGYWGGWGMGLYPIVSLSLKHKEELGLTPEQVSQLEKIQAEFGEEAKAQSGKMRTLGEGLKNDLEQNNFTGVEQKIREMGNIRTDLLIKRVEAFRKAKTEVLTSDQYNKLTEMLKSKWGSQGS